MKNQTARIILEGVPEGLSADIAKSIQEEIAEMYHNTKGIKLSIDHPEPPDPPVLFSKLYDKIGDLIGTIADEVDCSPEFGDDVSDGDGSTTIAGVRKDIRAFLKFSTDMEKHMANFQDVVEELTFAADKLERETKKGK